MREIRMLRTTWRKLETELRDGLRHRNMAKASGNSNSPSLWPPRQLSTLPEGTGGGSDVTSLPDQDEQNDHTFAQIWDAIFRLAL